MNGIILVNKPKNISSSNVVVRIKKLTGEKVGHLGTLDPLAVGILPICVGRATRLFDYCLNKTKTYVARFTFGYETDTLDLEGEVIKESNKIPTLKELDDAIFYNFLGQRRQMPPVYSSKKVNGVRAYDMARKGVKIDLKPADIFIYRFVILSKVDDNTFEFEIECSSGTYIRALARDLGEKVGSCATMTSLVRTEIGTYSLDKCLAFEDLSKENISKNLISIENILRDFRFPPMTISKKILKDLLDGKKFHLPNADENVLYGVYCDGDAVGIGKVENSFLKIKTYFL